MALTSGARLGPYEVTSQIGAGGMGEVYRATDTKLKRQVALKVLPPSVAADHDRLARFQREAEVLASLNHPNIAGIYGLQESAGTTALVMELVEGEDLSAVLTRGPLPVADALGIARQIAAALEAAHEQGIIHRDLKPANIKVREDGTVKVLDFGLAKALGAGGASATAGSSVSMSPTLTTPAMTEMGMILGTAAYMAPEQAKGRAVDRRADVWAFGTVLYEMLAGHRLFAGDDVSDTLANVLKSEPLWDQLPAETPSRVRLAVRACLQKDPKQRMGDMQSVRLALEGAFETVATATAAAAPAGPIARRWQRTLPWALAGLLGVGFVIAMVLWAPWHATPPPTPRKLLAGIGADASLSITFGASAILSPDGTTLAFVAVPDNQARSVLFVRKLDDLQAVALAGTEDAASPFFSPDGQWIAYFALGQLKKVSTTGGASIALCDAPGGRGGMWADDDTIIYTPEGTGANSRLMRVQAAGGAPSAFGALGADAVSQRWPQALPDGRGVLYTESSSLTDWDTGNLVVASTSAGTSGGEPRVVVHGGYFGRYVPPASAGGLGAPKRSLGGLGAPKRSEGGHLIYVNQGTLFAVPFDLERLETVGPAVPAVEGVRLSTTVGSAQVALSSDGTLVYVPGAIGPASWPIDWITRDGKTSVLRAAKTKWASPRFSPDGKRLAMDISDGKQRDVWVYELARDTLTQLTFDGAMDRNPVWTPDGRRIVFASDRAKAGVLNLYWVNADGTGEVTRLTDSPNSQGPSSWHPNGKFLAFVENGGVTSLDLMVLPMEGDATQGWTPGTPTVFLRTPASEGTPVFSPDGRFIAYASTEAGTSQYDVYVRPFPGPGGKWRVSTTAGGYPKWSAATHELLFVNYLDPTPSKVMAARYAVAGDSFQVETPRVWSPTSVQGVSLSNSAYDLHPDGQRIAAAAVVSGGQIVQDKVVFFFNFAEYLAKIAPGKP